SISTILCHRYSANRPLPSFPTRRSSDLEQRYEAKLANRTDLPPRHGLIWGETHDGNSFHAGGTAGNAGLFATARAVFRMAQAKQDRKSTRLNSSHVSISYAVFCLKKKNK